ncbi:hypothetical protein BJX63DRAFT_430750 [Aspergillus granulosus]|uniref:Uncharacterized protein n=1 Tax=Aspergillus granulosus TaxID=176169 RepID=A0ABR4HJ60_9EURO
MYKLLPLALLAYGASAAVGGPNTIGTTIVGTLPGDISTTIIADPSSAFDPEPSTETIIIVEPSIPAEPSVSSTIIVDPTFTPPPSDPATSTSIIIHPSFPLPTPTSQWTTTTIITDPTPGTPGAPGSEGPSATSTTIPDPGFTGAASALNAPFYEQQLGQSYEDLGESNTMVDV